MSIKTISKLLLNGEEYTIKDANLTDRVASIENVIGNGVDVDLSGFYTKTEVDNKLATAASNVETVVNEKVAEIVNGAPEQFDTLKELADALNEDKEGSVVNAIFTKIDNDKTELSDRIDTLEAIDHSQYLTEHQDLTDYAKTTEVEAKLTQFSGEFTNNYYDKTAIDDKLEENTNTIGAAVDLKLKDYPKTSQVNAAIQAVEDKVDALENYDDTDVKSRLTALEAIDHTEFLKGNALNDYYIKTEVDAAVKAVDDKLANYATTEYVDDEIKEIADGVDALADKVDALENYDDTDVKSRLTDLEAIDHTQYLTNSSLNNYYNKTEVDNKVANVATAVDATLEDYAKTADVNAAIQAVDNKVGHCLDNKNTVAVHKNGEFLNSQPNVMYFIYDEEETVERTPLKIKIIDNTGFGNSFQEQEDIYISNEKTKENFRKFVKYFTDGPIDTVLATETDTISVMCGSAKFGVEAFTACADNQYILLSLNASTTNRVVFEGVYWVENDQPVNNGPDVPTPTPGDNEQFIVE